ncbi:MAG: lysophospholipid acyltransferase family protein [Gemmatimonadota bacterium]|nr:lysophospholipid acyltransferase family protein [Gemmatimonadota bacterium]
MTVAGAVPSAKPQTKRRRWLIAAGGLALRALAATWRMREINGASYRNVRASGKPVVFAFWHGRMLPLLWKHRHEGAVVLISEHGDGEIIARVAVSLGYRTVRGSTFRGAQRALMGIIRELEAGHDAAFTPDGPRGPLEEFAAGAAVAAQRTGASLILVGAGATRAWRLKSWDRFLIPKPFARVTVEYADPQVMTHASARDAAADAPRLQAELKALTARADG